MEVLKERKAKRKTRDKGKGKGKRSRKQRSSDFDSEEDQYDDRYMGAAREQYLEEKFRKVGTTYNCLHILGLTHL
jgi:hypothetical protein